jgi:hypothetical protein
MNQLEIRIVEQRMMAERLYVHGVARRHRQHVLRP